MEYHVEEHVKQINHGAFGIKYKPGWNKKERARAGVGRGPRTKIYESENDAIAAMQDAKSDGNGATCVITGAGVNGGRITQTLSFLIDPVDFAEQIQSERKIAMSEQKHTPGPLSFERVLNGHKREWWVYSESEHLAVVEAADPTEEEYYARLFATSPDLLQACKDGLYQLTFLQDQIDEGYGDDRAEISREAGETVEAMKSAIANATGGQP